MEYFENDGPIIPVDQAKVFDMVMAMGENLVPCDVYFATMESGNTFTRVIMYPGTTAERLVDVDKQNGQWTCIYEMESTIWSELVGPSLDYHIAQNAGEHNPQN